MFWEAEWGEFHHAGSEGNRSPAPLGGKISNSVKTTPLDPCCKTRRLSSMGWSAAVREVWVASLVGRPRGGGGRFRLPWFGGVGCSCGGRLFLWLLCMMYVTLKTVPRVYDTYMFVRWCVDIILIQARYLFEFKNLTAICFHAARWI